MASDVTDVPSPRPGADPPLPATILMGLPIHGVTEAEVIQRILTSLARGRGGWVVTANVDIVRQVVRDRTLRGLVESASLRLADGTPLVWASRLQNNPLPSRIAGATLVWSLSRAAAQACTPIFLLGGAPGVAEQAAVMLKAAVPGLEVVGAHCPPFGFEDCPEALAEIVSSIGASNPGIVFCGLGCPKQERLMAQLTHQFPQTWFLAAGGSLDFIAGKTKRAPDWMQDAGLEWLHRLCHEPKRLFKRYLIHDLPFALQLLTQSVLLRLRLWNSP